MTIHFSGFDPGPAPIPDKFIKGEDFLRVGKGELRVIETPGHTQGSISLYSSKDKIVFVGDLLFADGAVGRTDLQGGDSNLLDISIKRILKLPEDTIVYPGHGEEFMLSERNKY